MKSTLKLREVPVVDTPKQPYNYRKVRSLIDSRLIYTGQISGEQYEWNRAGSNVDVDERDVPDLLTKRIGGNSCCGGQNTKGNQVFEIYDE